MSSPDPKSAPKEKPPLIVQAYLDLMRVRERLQRQLLALFKTHQLSEATYNVLRVVRGAGEGGLACKEIGRRLVNEVPDVTRLVDRLESRELVVRSRSEEDRRVWLVRLTAAGRELLAGFDQPVLELHEQQFSVLTQAELQLLSGLLQRLLNTPTPEHHLLRTEP